MVDADGSFYTRSLPMNSLLAERSRMIDDLVSARIQKSKWICGARVLAAKVAGRLRGLKVTGARVLFSSDMASRLVANDYGASFTTPLNSCDSRSRERSRRSRGYLAGLVES